MTQEEFDSLVKQIAELKTQCEELRVRNEMLHYHLDREKRTVRNLERQVQELTVETNFVPRTDPPLGWGKGKDE